MKNIWPVKTARCDTTLYFIACQPVFKKYKTFSVLIYSNYIYQHEWKLEKREIVWKHDVRREECFHTISTEFF